MMKKTNERWHLAKRIWKGNVESLFFYFFRIFSIQNKVVFCCIEGTTGYTCNPKYIAEELLKRGTKYQLVWLVNDTSKSFPSGIRVVRNTLINRAYQLTTAKVWIDNSRKQLEVRKRKGQLYIQTWHAKLGFKPTGLDRGSSLSAIAKLISEHDSSMTDYVLSNSKWYDDTLETGMLYKGAVLRTGSPRCDILINCRVAAREKVRREYGLESDAKILIYAPTFRGGSQGTRRVIDTGNIELDFVRLKKNLEQRFGNRWYVFLRLHPQLIARHKNLNEVSENVLDISEVDDLYEIMAGCDAFLTDYSSAAFDASVMNIPVFLYANDYDAYIKERGRLLWDMSMLPFPFASNEGELEQKILLFDENRYRKELETLFVNTDMVEDGHASSRVADFVAHYIGE